MHLSWPLSLSLNTAATQRRLGQGSAKVPEGSLVRSRTAGLFLALSMRPLQGSRLSSHPLDTHQMAHATAPGCAVV